jgi:hypothetical protein
MLPKNIVWSFRGEPSKCKLYAMKIREVVTISRLYTMVMRPNYANSNMCACTWAQKVCLLHKDWNEEKKNPLRSIWCNSSVSKCRKMLI